MVFYLWGPGINSIVVDSKWVLLIEFDFLFENYNVTIIQAGLDQGDKLVSVWSNGLCRNQGGTNGLVGINVSEFMGLCMCDTNER